MAVSTGPAPALPPAEIRWTPDGPCSDRFGEGYFGAADGLAEADHVFIEGNGLRERFAAVRAGEVFVLGELGFGTGTNALAALSAWACRGHDRGHLWIVSVEAYPLGRADLRRALDAAATTDAAGAAEAARRLVAAYPDPLPGQTTVRLGGDATLTLLFGEAASALDAAGFAADAWMLDGFSPRTNPGMWRDEVFTLVAARSRAGATAATFTVAGTVRRGLERAGFAWRKRPGFGRKRECLAAQRPGTPELAAAPRVAILGGGIAGAACAAQLLRLGASPVLFDPAPASGASGNPGGLVTPRLQAADDAHARFYRDAYLFAGRFYAEACPDALTLCGADVAVAETRLQKILSLGFWPSGELTARPGGLHAPNALVIRPAEAVAALLDGIEVRRVAPVSLAELIADTAFDAVVVATGAGTLRLLADDALRGALTARRGQVDRFAGPPPPRILSGDGYAAPLGEEVLAGATYGPAPPDDAVQPSSPDSEANAATASQLMNRAPGPSLGARASVRLAARDRHPVAGFHEGAYLLTALGSRGLVTAPLLAADAASALLGAPRLLPHDQLNVLQPDRFARRANRLQTGS